MTGRVLALAVVWVSLLGAGLYRSYAFETAPGPRDATPATWPRDSALIPSRDGATLVMFAHPDCPCTEASLAELATLLAELAAPPRVLVVFTAAGDPSPSPTWERVGQMPALVRLRDDGREAHRFGARTSGHVVVYDRSGALRFTGGVTGSRGHVGDNVGRRAIAAALRGGSSPQSHGVFGCSLEGGG